MSTAQTNLFTDNNPIVESDEKFRGILKPGNRKQYVFAGKAFMTIRNPKTGGRFTFRVTKPKKTFRTDCFYVSVLNGPNNEKNYAYIGAIFTDKLVTTKASKVKLTAPSAVAFTWFLKNQEDPRIEVWHEGACGKCGRKLTVPESIETGLGPVCEKY